MFRGWTLPSEEVCMYCSCETSKVGVSTAGAVSACSTVEDGESSRMSEKAAERKAEIQKSSFVTLALTNWLC